MCHGDILTSVSFVACYSPSMMLVLVAVQVMSCAAQRFNPSRAHGRYSFAACWCSTTGRGIYSGTHSKFKPSGDLSLP